MAFMASMAEGSGHMAAQAPKERPIDLVHLSTYTLGNRSLETELLGLFRTQADLYISRLEAATSADEWKNTAHSLKGSAKGLGAWTVAMLAEKAEAAAGADATTRRAMLGDISDALSAVKHFIDSMAD